MCECALYQLLQLFSPAIKKKKKKKNKKKRRKERKRENKSDWSMIFQVAPSRSFDYKGAHLLEKFPTTPHENK